MNLVLLWWLMLLRQYLTLPLPSNTSLLVAPMLCVVLCLLLCCGRYLSSAKFVRSVLRMSLLPAILTAFQEVLDHESSARSESLFVSRHGA